MLTKMKKIQITFLVIIACLVMAIVDAVIQPGYAIKSGIKIVMFLLIPILYGVFNKECGIKSLMKPDKKGFVIALTFGVGVYAIVFGVYLLLFKYVFDFSAVTTSLNETTGANKSNFLWGALYISFVNSLLEEFFFRGFSFIILKRYTSRRFAYIFSSLMFALYHIPMMNGWFGVPVFLISLVGLFAGGMIFNRFDEENGNIYLSWLIHIFANFATNTIGFVLFVA